jgi:hypothetical protein
LSYWGSLILIALTLLKMEAEEERLEDKMQSHFVDTSVRRTGL